MASFDNHSLVSSSEASEGILNGSEGYSERLRSRYVKRVRTTAVVIAICGILCLYGLATWQHTSNNLSRGSAGEAEEFTEAAPGKTDAFAVLFKFKAPEENHSALYKLDEETADKQFEEMPGMLFQRFTVDPDDPNQIFLAEVFEHDDAFAKHVESSIMGNWFKTSGGLGVEINGCYVFGDTGEAKDKIPPMCVLYPQVAGFARPHSGTDKSKAFAVEFKMKMPASNVSAWNELTEKTAKAQFESKALSGMVFHRFCAEPDKPEVVDLFEVFLDDKAFLTHAGSDLLAGYFGKFAALGGTQEACNVFGDPGDAKKALASLGCVFFSQVTGFARY